jgi:hypothetical protein
MKCQACADEGATSTVTEVAEEVTCMGWSPFWDEAGRRHSHDPNETTTHFVCSNGHRFHVKQPVAPCEVCELVKAGVI